MAFKPQRKRRMQGERFPIGFIKRKIVLIIAYQFPEEVKEPVLRDILRDKWEISEPKGVKIHLENLEKKVLDKKEKKGSANLWKLSQDYEAFKSLIQDFHNSEDEIEFLRSKYAQSMINGEFVNHFAYDLGKEYSDFLFGFYADAWDSIEDKKLKNLLDEISTKSSDKAKEKLIELFYHCTGITREMFIQMIRESMSCLYNFLFTDEIRKGVAILHPKDYFLYPFISDMTYQPPEGKGIEVKLEMKFGDLTESEGKKGTANWLKPTLEVKTSSRISMPKHWPVSEVYGSKSSEKPLKKKRKKHADNP